MLKEEGVVEIIILKRQGYSIRRIARELGVSRNTAGSYLRSSKPPGYSSHPGRPSKLDVFKPHIQSRVKAASPDWIPATVMNREIVERGYAGSERTVGSYLAPLKPAARPDPPVRFETKPGQQMQVDWGVFRRGKDLLSPG